MYDELIESMLYKKSDNMRSTYRFNFLSRRAQEGFQIRLRLCLEADCFHSRMSKAYQGHNPEAQEATLWHREMAKAWYHDFKWDELQRNLEPAQQEKMAELRKAYRIHAMFAHHTLESLLYVATRVLPLLQSQARRAQTLLSRWKRLPWVPKIFIDHYQGYLTNVMEQLSEMEAQLNRAIQVRVDLAFHAPDGKTCDVLMVLTEQLRLLVPGFTTEVRLTQEPLTIAVVEKLSHTKVQLTRDLIALIEKKSCLAQPNTRRYATAEELGQAVQYLKQQRATQTWVKNIVEDGVASVNEAPLVLQSLRNRGGFELFPSAWLPKGVTSRQAVVKHYPWFRYWTMRENVALLQAQMRMQQLLEAGNPLSVDPHGVTAQFDKIDALDHTKHVLENAQKEIAAYQPRGFWQRFFDWKKTKRYQVFQRQQVALQQTIQAINDAKVDWVLNNASVWITHAEHYTGAHN